MGSLGFGSSSACPRGFPARWRPTWPLSYGPGGAIDAEAHRRGVTIDLDDAGAITAVDVRRARVRSHERLDYASAKTADERIALLGERITVRLTHADPLQRRASGRSIIGLAVFDHSTLRTEALGRSWSQGRLLSWLV